ncbi:MAG TPA: hydrogenase nickel incorporation protein HypB [Candidatus Sulfopaludibacter sp.]|nr:hydrogenase nickel incorporation protein HypB [Candidatus Sulfopaludibacter sp.]
MTRVPMEGKVLNENERLAAGLRDDFARHGVFALNLISSPGSGKTTLLERTLEAFDPARRVAVLTGDIQTDADAARLRRYGFPVRQITTAGACHLDARMVRRALEGWDLAALDLLFIENVGNLVCPTSYDLGEAHKIVLLSVTEGDEKPLKYPGIFYKSELMLLTKIDLLPYVPFQPEVAEANARSVNPNIEIRRLSCATGAGIDLWLHWIERARRSQFDICQP